MSLEELQGGVPKKRTIVRRPLSCNACKRRKTRCSGSHAIPCAACVARKRPGECIWDFPPGHELAPAASTADGPPPQYVLRSELDSLQGQLEALRATMHQAAGGAGPAPPSISSHAPSGTVSPAALQSPATSVSDHAPTPPDIDIDSALLKLERYVQLQSHSTEGGVHSRSASGMPSPAGGFTFSSFLPPQMRVLPPVLDGRRRTSSIVATIFDILPADMAGVNLLVEAYVGGEFHRGWHILHEGVFRMEVQAFMALQPAERLGADPAWLAVLMMVLAHGLREIPIHLHATIFPYDVDSLRELPSSLYRASLLALDAAEATTVPQVRHLQALLLAYPFLFHFGSGSDDATTARAHLSAATLTAQALGMDTLTTANALPTTLIQDNAFTGLPVPVVFELAKRLFAWISFLDGANAEAGLWRLGSSNIRPLTTPPPLNLQDDDLMESSIRPARLASEFTHSTIAIAGQMYASHVREFMEQSSRMQKDTDWTESGEMNVETIAAYDGALRKVLEVLPNPLESSSPNWLQCTLWSGLHNRLMRLHRPYFALGYSNPVYQTSREACLDSAWMLIRSQQLLNATPALRPNFVARWLLGASTILTVDLVISIDCRQSPSTLAVKRGELQAALDIFSAPSEAERQPLVRDQCARTVQALLMACDERTAVRRATVSSPPGAGSDLKGFFGRVDALLKESVIEATRATTSLSALSSASYHPLSSPITGFDPTLYSLPAAPTGMQQFAPELSSFTFAQLDTFDFVPSMPAQPTAFREGMKSDPWMAWDA